MSHGDDIRTIWARTDLDPDEKRRRAREVKGRACRGIAARVVNEPWQDGDLTINVTSLEVNADHRVVVWCEAWRDGARLTLDLPFIYVNPPLIHNGEESPLAALRQMIVSTLARF